MSQPATCDLSDVTPSLGLDTCSKATTVPTMPPSPRDPASNARQPRPMNALARLIRRRKEELELSWPELAKRGGFKSHTIIFSLATKTEHRQVPRAETLARLAKAIDVPLDMVKAAAAEAAGFTVQDIPTTLGAATDVRIVAAILGDLDEGDREMLTNIAESFYDQVQRRRKGEAQG